MKYFFAISLNNSTVYDPTVDFGRHMVDFSRCLKWTLVVVSVDFGRCFGGL